MSALSSTFFLVVLFAMFASLNALPLPEEAIENNDIYLVRLKRSCTCTDSKHDHARETVYDINNHGAALGQKVTWVNNDNHKLSTTHTAERDFQMKGPLTTTHSAQYDHKPTSSNFQISTSNTRGVGKDVSASGQYNFFQTDDKKGRIGVGAEYQRSYGPNGPSDPNYNVFVKGSYDLN